MAIPALAALRVMGTAGHRAATTTNRARHERTVTVVCEAGPDAGVSATLGPGRHVVGRAGWAAVPLADGTVEPHHAVLDVDVDIDGDVDVDVDGDVDGEDDGGGRRARVRFHQLAGRVPCRLDGQPVTGAGALPAGGVLEVGTTRLRLLDAGAAAPPVSSAPIVIPPPPPAVGRSAWRLVVAAVLVASAVVAPAGELVLVAAAALAGGHGWTARRLRRAADDAERLRLDAIAAAVDAQREVWGRGQRRRAPGLAAVVAAGGRRHGRGTDALPAVESEPARELAAVLGWGPHPFAASIASGEEPADAAALAVIAAHERPIDAPAIVSLTSGTDLVLAGAEAAAVARSVVVQLAGAHSPAAWRLVIDTDGAAWDWARRLPHHRRAVRGDTALAVTIVDRARGGVAAAGTAPASDGSGARIIVDAGGVEPIGGAATAARLAVCASSRGRWAPGGGAATIPLHVAGIGAAAAASIARRWGVATPAAGAVDASTGASGVARAAGPAAPASAAGRRPSSVAVSRSAVVRRRAATGLGRRRHAR